MTNEDLVTLAAVVERHNTRIEQLITQFDSLTQRAAFLEGQVSILVAAFNTQNDRFSVILDKVATAKVA